jgi:NAD+ diphosphatase
VIACGVRAADLKISSHFAPAGSGSLQRLQSGESPAMTRIRCWLCWVCGVREDGRLVSRARDRSSCWSAQLPACFSLRPYPEAVAGSLISATGQIALTRHEIERATGLRGDPDWLASAWADPHTHVLVVHDGQALMRMADGAAELVFTTPELAPEGTRFLLGVDADDVAYFGVGAAAPQGALGPHYGAADESQQAGAGEEIRPAGLRDAGTLLADRDAGLLVHAVALANWHGVAGYCSRCGSLTEPIMAGHARRCTNDGSEHFPRCDPAVIMQVSDPDDRCLLARNAQWPQGRVSILAGFVEAGESAEQAVAREVHEEVGVVVDAVTYAGSQPWPMPHSLMLGFRAEATGTDICVDAEEIAEARWYSRDDLRIAILSGELLMPPSLSISRWLIETWYGEPLPKRSMAAGAT